MKRTMKCGLLSLILAVATTLTVAMPSSRAQTPRAYGLHELPADATLHTVTATPASARRRAIAAERSGGTSDSFVTWPIATRPP